MTTIKLSRITVLFAVATPFPQPSKTHQTACAQQRVCRIQATHVFRPTILGLLLLLASLAPCTSKTWGAIMVMGDFLSGPTGSPPISTDPAFWTSGGDSNTDPTLLPSTDGIVGVTGNGTLTISGGSQLNLNHLDLGQNPGANGTTHVMGAGSSLNLGRHFHIGAHADDASTLDGGNGMLSITNGGLVEALSDIWLGDSATSTGTVVVDGAGSVLRTGDDMWLGDDGMGSLTVRNGGLVEVADVTDVGDEPGANGILTVDGVGSIFRTRDIDIGDDGRGTGTVTNGARLEAADDIQIANDVGGDLSVLTVQGSNSTVIATDQIRVGDDARGTLNILAGARAQAGDLFVGGNSTGTGTMTVDGVGTLVVADADFISGLGGQGDVTIKDGGRVEAAVVRLGDGETGVGVIRVQGSDSTIVSADSYLVGFGGSGHLVVSDGARAEAAGDLFLGINVGSVGHITVQGAGSTLETTGGSIIMGPQGGNGRLRVLEGAHVAAFANVALATEETSDSWATIRGSGSRLSSNSIDVGGGGRGELNVLDGGQAMATVQIILGNDATGVGVVNIRGVSSQISSDALGVGIDGIGTFNLSEAGSASFETAEVSATSTVNLVVSGDNMLAATNAYTNDGVTNFIAGSQLASGSYAPINSSSYLGLGSYVGVGGTISFPSSGPTFTAGSIIIDSGDGTEDFVNGGDRVQFGEVTIGLNENAGADGSLTVTDLNLLTVLGDEALSTLSFAASGLDTSLLHALSFDVGLQDRDTLTILQRTTGASDNAWVVYEPAITDYTNGAFTFTVNELDGFDFAVVVPEPTTLFMFLLGGLLVARRRW